MGTCHNNVDTSKSGVRRRKGVSNIPKVIFVEELLRITGPVVHVVPKVARARGQAAQTGFDRALLGLIL